MREIDFGNQGQNPQDSFYSIRETREVRFPLFSYCDIATKKTHINFIPTQIELWPEDLAFNPKPLEATRKKEKEAILSLMRDLPILRSTSGVLQDPNIWRELNLKLVERFYSLSGCPLGSSQTSNA